MPHPEVALHPIHGPDGSTALPVGHPMHRDGDETLPDAWGRDFVDEMIAGGYAATPDSSAAEAVAAERKAADDFSPEAVSARLAAGCTPAGLIETGMRG